MKKKFIALTLCLALVVVGVIGSTLAYYTDTREVKNVFTLGDVKIELRECELDRVNDGQPRQDRDDPLQWDSETCIVNPNTDLEGDAANTPNYVSSGESWREGYFSDAQIRDRAEHYKDEQDGYFTLRSELMEPGCYLRKCPYIDNVGPSPAYVRLRVYCPINDFVHVVENENINPAEVVKEDLGTRTLSAVVQVPGTDEEGNPITVEQEVTRDYQVYQYTYQTPVQPGELTFWNPVCAVYIDKGAEHENLEDLQMLLGDAGFDVIFQADAIQTKTFADVNEAFASMDVHGVTVSGGTADPVNAKEGDTVTIIAEAPAEGMVFKCWKALGGNVVFADANAAETSFVMPAEDVQVEAEYEQLYTVTVTGGTAEPAAALAGTTITITADEPAEGQVFTGWTVSEGVELADAAAAVTTFVMPAQDVAVVAGAGQLYNVTVNGGTADPAAALAGATVTVKAVSTAQFKFVRWTGEVELADANAEETTFTMPEADVAVTAEFRENYAATAEYRGDNICTNGTGSYGEPGFWNQSDATHTNDNNVYHAGKLIDGEKPNDWSNKGAKGKNIEFVKKGFGVGPFRLYFKLAEETQVTQVNAYAGMRDTGGNRVYPVPFNIYVGHSEDDVSEATLFGQADTVDESIVRNYTATGDKTGTYVIIDTEIPGGSACIAFCEVEIYGNPVAPEPPAPTVYAVAVEGGTSDVAEAAEGDTVTITAGDAPEGQEFDKWEGNAEFADANAASTTFVMPAEDVSVKATYKEVAPPEPPAEPANVAEGKMYKYSVAPYSSYSDGGVADEWHGVLLTNGEPTTEEPGQASYCGVTNGYVGYISKLSDYTVIVDLGAMYDISLVKMDIFWNESDHYSKTSQPIRFDCAYSADGENWSSETSMIDNYEERPVYHNTEIQTRTAKIHKCATAGTGVRYVRFTISTDDTYPRLYMDEIEVWGVPAV